MTEQQVICNLGERNSHHKPQDPYHGEISHVDPVAGIWWIMDEEIRTLDEVHGE